MRMGWVSALVVMGITTAARADGYFFNEGLGPGAKVSSELASQVSGSGISLRVGLGRRLGPWAVEGVLFGSNLQASEAQASPAASLPAKYTALSYGVDFRYFVPLSDSLDAYLRGGLHGTSLTNGQGTADPTHFADYGGRGYDYGAGLQYVWRPFRVLPAFNPIRSLEFALWADLTEQVIRLNKDNAPSLDGDLRMWTFGFSMGTNL